MSRDEHIDLARNIHECFRCLGPLQQKSNGHPRFAAATEPTCEVEGKQPLRRDVIERGGSSEAWYGGRARRSVPRRTASSTPRFFAAVLGGYPLRFSMQWVQRLATAGYPLRLSCNGWNATNRHE